MSSRRDTETDETGECDCAGHRQQHAERGAVEIEQEEQGDAGEAHDGVSSEDDPPSLVGHEVDVEELGDGVSATEKGHDDPPHDDLAAKHVIHPGRLGRREVDGRAGSRRRDRGDHRSGDQDVGLLSARAGKGRDHLWQPEGGGVVDELDGCEDRARQPDGPCRLEAGGQEPEREPGERLDEDAGHDPGRAPDDVPVTAVGGVRSHGACWPNLRPPATVPRPVRMVIRPTRGLRTTTKNSEAAPPSTSAQPERGEQPRGPRIAPHRTEDVVFAGPFTDCRADQSDDDRETDGAPEVLGEWAGEHELPASYEPGPFQEQDEHGDAEAEGRELEEEPGSSESDESRGERDEQPAHAPEQPTDGGEGHDDRDGGPRDPRWRSLT